MIVLTALVVTIVVAAGGVLIGLAVKADLVESADEVGASWADKVSRQVEQDNLPATLPELVDDEEAAVQVVSGGRVLAATPNLEAAAVLDLPQPPVGTRQVFEVERLPLTEEGPFRVAAVGVAAPAGDVTIFVAISVNDVAETVASAARVGGAGIALLVLALCGVMWFVIGKTLAPVDAITAQAEEVSGNQLDRRVPEPVQDDEIGRLARTVNAMLARLQGSAERQRRFVADAAHELRNPIASIRAQLETARDGTGGVQALVPDLMYETLRMHALVDQLLLLTRSDAGSLAPNRQAVDLDDTVEAAVTSCQGDVAVDLSAVCPVQLSGDPHLLEQVARNLIENAVRYAAAEVRVGLSADATEAVLTVEDDGPGVPERHREVVFNRFTRLDAARDRGGGGVGLGLAIVAGIVSAHDGSVEVTDSPVGGARFTVRLPLNGAALDY